VDVVMSEPAMAAPVVVTNVRRFMVGDEEYVPRT
jgi:hypothetical protein